MTVTPRASLLPCRPRSLAALVAPLALVATLFAQGCGMAVHQPPHAAFDVEGSKEINDEDVKKAFDARAQMTSPARVAFYTFDPDKAVPLEEMLSKVPGVSSVYRIPPLMVTGQRRFDESRPYQAPAEVSVKKLRVLAARAHADVLVVFDYGHRDGTANGWTALTPLLVPILFVPFLDNTVESYLEAYVIDTRNGYLYAHIAADEQGGNSRATIWSKPQDETVKEQWGAVLSKTGVAIGKLLKDPASAPPASVAGSAPPAPAAAAPAAAR